MPSEFWLIPLQVLDDLSNWLNLVGLLVHELLAEEPHTIVSLSYPFRRHSRAPLVPLPEWSQDECAEEDIC